MRVRSMGVAAMAAAASLVSVNPVSAQDVYKFKAAPLFAYGLSNGQVIVEFAQASNPGPTMDDPMWLCDTIKKTCAQLKKRSDTSGMEADEKFEIVFEGHEHDARLTGDRHGVRSVCGSFSENVVPVDTDKLSDLSKYTFKPWARAEMHFVEGMRLLAIIHSDMPHEEPRAYFSGKDGMKPVYIKTLTRSSAGSAYDVTLDDEQFTLVTNNKSDDEGQAFLKGALMRSAERVDVIDFKDFKEVARDFKFAELPPYQLTLPCPKVMAITAP